MDTIDEVLVINALLSKYSVAFNKNILKNLMLFIYELTLYKNDNAGDK